MTAPDKPIADPVVLGIAGAIGSGKSKVASAFAELGWLVIDFDREVRKALDRPEVRETLVSWWGERVLDPQGLPDRGVIAEIVFADPEQRRRLEGLIHPLVLVSGGQARELARQAGSPGILLDAPLLFESGQDEACDAVIFVDAPIETRIGRVEKHRGWTEAELRRREAGQMPLEEKRARCRFVIFNDKGKNRLREQIAEICAIMEQQRSQEAS